MMIKILTSSLEILARQQRIELKIALDLHSLLKTRGHLMLIFLNLCFLTKDDCIGWQ